jgi:hypothetical protein
MFTIPECLCHPQNSHAEILTPNVMLLGGGACGVLYGPKETRILPFCHMMTKRGPSSDTVPASTLTLTLTLDCEKYFLLFVSHKHFCIRLNNALYL